MTYRNRNRRRPMSAADAYDMWEREQEERAMSVYEQDMEQAQKELPEMIREFEEERAANPKKNSRANRRPTLRDAYKRIVMRRS